MSNTEENTCEFCGKSFVKESTLIAHTCRKKLRWLERDSRVNKLAFFTFSRFYELTRTMNSRKAVTYEKFMDSNMFNDFMNFSRWMLDSHIHNPHSYIDYVIKNSFKINDWTKNSVYENYVKESILKESVDSALERGMVYISDWAEKNSESLSAFFIKANPHRIVHDIKLGKFSPWLLFICPSADALMDRLDESHYKLLGKLIDSTTWNMNIKKYKEDVEEIKEIIKSVGL